MTCLDHLDPALRETFLRTAGGGGYHLLLGAGASRDSTDSHGNQLPDGKQLAQEISRSFGLTNPDTDLQTAYERASDRDRSGLMRYLRSRLLNTRPAAWYSHVTRMAWRRIWTLNIDDIVEKAYQTNDKVALQRPRSRTWSEPLDEDPILQIVHLHGSLAHTADANLVFGILEYLQAVESLHSWHRRFGELWQTEPFIVVGASLRYEFDLARVFRSQRTASPSPSFYVSPDIDDDSEGDLLRWGLVPIRADAKFFFEQIAPEIVRRQPAYFRPWQLVTDRIAAPTFSQQFRHLTQEPGTTPRRHDFYRGHEPRWEDILARKDANLTWTAERIELVDRQAPRAGSPNQRLVLLSGARFSGKSVSLFQAARWFVEKSFPVFLFRGEQNLRVDVALSLLTDMGNAILLFDGLADFVRPVADLLKQARDRNVAVLIIGTERDNREPLLISSLDEIAFPAENLIRIPKVLSRRDANELIQSLVLAGRLGSLEPLTSNRMRVNTLTSLGLFDGLAMVEYGEGFRQRLDSELRDLPTDELRKLVFLVSVIHETAGYRTPLTVASVVGLSPSEIVRSAAAIEAVDAVLELDGNQLVPRHRRLSAGVLHSILPPDAVLDLLVRVFDHLRASVNERTKDSGSIQGRIVGELMRARKLRNYIGVDRLDEFYEHVREWYAWNGRYWEQRAVAASLRNDWTPAESFAARAATLVPDDKRHNTLGFVLIRKAAEVSQERSAFRDTYARALQAFQFARQFNPENHIPIITFLEGLLYLAEHSLDLKRAGLLDIYSRDWNQWLADYSHHPVMRFDSERAELEKKRWRWMQLMVSLDGISS